MKKKTTFFSVASLSEEVGKVLGLKGLILALKGLVLVHVLEQSKI